MNRPDRKEDVLARLVASRDAIGENLAGLGAAVNLTRRLRHAVRRNPIPWLAGSVGAGVLLSSLLRVGGGRPSKSGGGALANPSRPVILGALAFLGNQMMAFSLPALKQFVEVELSRWLQSRAPKTPADEAHGG